MIVGLLVLVLRTLLGNYITDALASPGYTVATHHLWLIGTSILGQIGAATLLYGVITALGAVYAGPTSIAVRLRQSLAPTMNERQGIVWGAVGLVYPPRDPLGRNARVAHLVGHPPARRVDRGRRRSVAAAEPQRVPDRNGGPAPTPPPEPRRAKPNA